MKWSSVGLAACQGLNGHMWVVAILSVQLRHLDRRFYWTELSCESLRLPPTEFPPRSAKMGYSRSWESYLKIPTQGGMKASRADQNQRQQIVAPSFSQRCQKCYPFQRCVMLRKTRENIILGHLKGRVLNLIKDKSSLTSEMSIISQVST